MPASIHACHEIVIRRSITRHGCSVPPPPPGWLFHLATALTLNTTEILRRILAFIQLLSSLCKILVGEPWQVPVSN